MTLCHKLALLFQIACYRVVKFKRDQADTITGRFAVEFRLQLPLYLTNKPGSNAGTLNGVGVPLDDFLKLTRIPIMIYYGDNIPATPTDNPGQDFWRARQYPLPFL